MKKRLKLRSKLALFYAAVFSLLLATAFALFYNLLAYQLDKDLRDELRDRAAGLRGYVHWEGDEARLIYDLDDAEEAFFVGNAARFFQIYDAASGAMVLRSQAMRSLGFEYTPREVRDLIHGPDFTGLSTDQVDLLFYNDLFAAPNGRRYLMQVGASLGPKNTALSRLLHIILWAPPAAILLALLSGWWMAGRVLRPLESLRAAAAAIGISELHTRLPLSGTEDELDRLANTFNDMFSRLEEAVGQMKDFTASISHELRTPLTVLKGEAEVALVRARTSDDCRRVLESQLEEFDKLSRMIDHMLMLARAEAGQIRLAREAVSLTNLAESLTEQMEDLAANREISLVFERGENITVSGDAGWLERLVLNLLDNAIKFTAPHGRVVVKAYAADGEAILEVCDNGMGIPEHALPHIFERFYRGDDSRSRDIEGAGLGLSLVEWIVKQHDGRIHVKSRPGEGTVVRVMLPIWVAS